MQRIAIVTGAARGLGRAAAERLAAEGHHLVCVDRAETVREVAASLKAGGMHAEAVVAELGDPKMAEVVIGDAVARHGRIDILLNNAGFGISRGDRPASIDEMTIEEWNAVLAVNLTTPFVLSRAAIPHMRQGGWGRIINVSSRAGRTGIAAAEAAYSAAKAGALGLTRYLASITGGDGITVNAIAPGRFDTVLAGNIDPAMYAAALAGIPVGRIGQPREFAAAVAFLASEDAGFVTGATIDVNGGALMA